LTFSRKKESIATRANNL